MTGRDLPIRTTTPFTKSRHLFSSNFVILRILTTLMFVLGLTTAISAAEVKVPSYTLKLVKKLVEPQPASEFDCRERVYLMTTWFQVYGKHRITARWFNPEGTLQDEGHLDFVGKDKETGGWLALEFLNVKDRAASTHFNAEAAKFYGKWKVRVFLDNQFLEEREFFVRCK